MLQMRGFSHRGACEKSLEGNDRGLEGNGGPSGGVPILYKGQLRLAYAAWERGKAKGRSP